MSGLWINTGKLQIKNPIKTPNSYKIIKRAEKLLMNERVRNINYTLDMLKTKRDTCRNKLVTVVNRDKQLFSECLVFMDKIKQVRHSKTLGRHINKFNRLQQKHRGICCRQYYHVQQVSPTSNNNRDVSLNRDSCNNNNKNNNLNMVDITKKWVLNVLSSPLTEAQTSLLAMGPKFMVVPRHPLKGEYIAAVEKVCLFLTLKTGS